MHFSPQAMVHLLRARATLHPRDMFSLSLLRATLHPRDMLSLSLLRDMLSLLKDILCSSRQIRQWWSRPKLHLLSPKLLCEYLH